jgi:hypothetical protein
MKAGTLEIEMLANLARLQSDMRQVTGVVGGAMSKVESLVAGGVRALSGLGVGLSAGMFVGFIDKSIEAMGAMHELSQRTGVTVETLSALELVAAQSGTNMEGVASTVQKLTKNMMAFVADGSSKAGESFKALGITQAQAKAGLDNMDAFLPQFAKKLTEAGISGREVAAAQELMGKAGANNLPFLVQLAEAGKLNAKYTADQARAADDFKDSQAKLRDESSKFGIALANDVLPSLNKIITAMVKAREEGEGFWGAMMRGMQVFMTGTDLHKANVEFAKKTAELVAHEHALQGLSSSVAPGVSQRHRDNIARLKEELKVLQAFRNQLEKEEAAPPKPKATGGGAGFPVDSAAMKKAEMLLEKYRDKLRSINEEMMKMEGIDSPLLTMQRLIATDKDFRAMPEAHKRELLDAAELLGIKKALAEQEKERVEAIAVGEAESTKWRTAAIVDSRKLADAYLDQIDPLRAIKREHAEIDQLVASGWLTEMEARLAKLPAQVRELLHPVSSLHNEIQKAWEAGRLTTDEMQTALSRVQGPIDKTNDMAQRLGMTFTSTFEELVFGSKRGVGALDLLQAAALDVAKAVFRIQFTEPVAKWIGGLDFGRLWTGGATSVPDVMPYGFDSLVGGGEGYASGTDYVPRTGLALVHQGERIIPASENMGGGVVVNVINPPGAPMTAKQSNPRFDAGRMIIDVVLTAVSNDAGTRDKLRTALGAPS